MTGDAFIQFAAELAARGSSPDPSKHDSDEARFRSAVSRAYYGAFNLGVQFLEKLGFRAPSSGNKHFYVRVRLSQSGDEEVARAGGLLSDLQSERNDANYDLADPGVGTQQVAMTSVETAHEIRRALTGCSEPRCSAIKTAILNYEKLIKEGRASR